MIRILNNETMKRFKWIVFCIFILCLYAVVQIRLGWLWNIGCVMNADAINSIIEGLSYSYIAAYLFYILTSFLPSRRRRKKIEPIIRSKVQKIGENEIYSILLEFGRDTKYSSDYRTTQDTAKILKSKNWDSNISIMRKFFGVNTTYLRYVNAHSQSIRERISDIIIRYKEVLSEDEIVALENFSEMFFFKLIGSLCLHPSITVNDNVDSLIKEFVKMQSKYIEVEKVFGIKK